MNATSASPGSNRDPEQLERAAERIRADLDRTLGALERKLQPSQLLDRSLAYLREHGGEMANAVGDSVRRNPVPILLTAAGLGWLIISAVRTREPIDVTIGDEYPGDDADDFPLADRVVSAIEQRPLLFGGLAVAIGALLGTVIPSTHYEDEVVGELRDRAVERAKQMGERQYQNLRSRFDTQDLEVSGQAH
jgi:uncharacterized protein DUF3618